MKYMIKKEILKDIIRKLHRGANPDEVKETFKGVVKGASPTEIAQVEEELIKEGMPVEEVRRLCDVHLAVFRESLEKEETLAPPGHPIYILMEEHKMLLKFAAELREVAKEGFDSRNLNRIVENFKGSESHYLREENVLFPYLEKHGITQPPAIMWMEHDQIREIKKNLYRLVDARENGKQLEKVATSLADMLSSHFYKENNILFPTSLKVIEENEWKDIKRQFDEIGYTHFTPYVSKTPEEGKEAPKPEIEGMVSFETGALSKEEIEAIFNTLPVEITFVDKEDIVRYFNEPAERIFLRAKAVIGRKVQGCHPQKSLHLVNQILEDFRSGRRDVAEFWIEHEGRLIHIRYFAVRDGDYLGCMEVAQDITDIKKIEGEKRLL